MDRIRTIADDRAPTVGQTARITRRGQDDNQLQDAVLGLICHTIMPYQTGAHGYGNQDHP